jgi:hypothetical protein
MLSPYLFLLLFILENRSCPRASNDVKTKTDLLSCLRHAFGYILVLCFKAPE